MSFKKILLFILGLISLALGIIGIFLPLLPTTPFLLLSAYCFLRSSNRFYAWLINHKVLGDPIKNYMEHQSIKKNTKIGALVFLWISLIISIIFIDILVVRLILAAVGIGVTIHILLIKTLD